MQIKFYADLDNYLESTEELKNEWIENNLILLEVDLSRVQSGETTSQEFMELIASHQIEIINYVSSGAVKIMHNKNTVAEWAAPEFKIIKDNEGKRYYEISVENWSLMDQDIEINQG